MRDTFYITTPIYYVNDVPHIGHAYTTVAADVLARHYRQWNYDVFFLTGVDEHGQKVQQAAAKAGIDPQTYCDRMVPSFQNLWKSLNISNNAFIRTTHPEHKTIVKEYLSKLYEDGQIYSADYTGWYCTFDERFWTEKDVVDGLCPDCKRPVERLSEKNYFFKMSQYSDKLERHISQHYNPPDSYIGPQSRCNEVLGFLRNPLEDLSISRPKSRLSWGIELPFDADYVTYVWFDALVNYISALHYLTEEGKHDPRASFERYWSSGHSGAMGRNHKIVHLVGKDILTTHAVYWSTILMALGIALPTTIYAHGWWTVDGEKMSKSRGNVIDPNLVASEFGVDAFRYFLMREVPFGQDGDFSKEAVANRINSELSDGLGNLLSRTLAMIEKYCDGKIPAPHENVSTLDESAVTVTLGENIAIAKDHIEQMRFSRALEAIWESLQYCDRYIEKNAPWKLAKNVADSPKVDCVLYNVVRSLECVLPYIYPFMPETAYEMARQLGLNPKMEQNRLIVETLRPGSLVSKDRPLFPRIEPPRAQGETRVTDQPSAQPTSVTSPGPTAAPQPAQPVEAPAVPQITIEDFQKIQLKTATVVTAERVPRSDKLLKLQVDLGTEQRQIVAGIGKKYEPEALVGRRIVIVANLKPAKLMGIESQGMVLAAGDKGVEGLVTLLEDVSPGTKVK